MIKYKEAKLNGEKSNDRIGRFKLRMLSTK